MSRLVNATSWTTLATVINLILTMAQLAFLVRVLAPSIFGQFAIVNMVIEVFLAFALGGISNFLIYKRNADEKTSNAIYFLALGIGAIFSTVLFLITPYLASMLGYDSIVQELRLATMLLVLSSLSAQYQAVGMKTFKHQKVAKIDIVAKIISFLFAIFFAHLELLCLVGAAVIYQLLRLVGFMAILGKDINLSVKVNTSIYREAFNYGIFDFGSQAINIFRKQLDVIILAVTLPSSDLGIYHIIKQLASRPAQALQPIIGKVALPAFAEVKNDAIKFGRVYKDFFILQLFALACIYVPVIIASDLVTVLFFGNEFSQHSLILSLLATFWFVRVASSNLVGPLVQATGLTKRNFLWNIAVLTPNALVIYISSQYGVLALVSAMTLFQLSLLPIVNYYFIFFITRVDFVFAVKRMMLVVMLLIVPLCIMKILILPVMPNIFLLKEFAIGLLTLATAIFILFCYAELKEALSRVKGF